MGAAVDQGPVTKGAYPFLCMASFTKSNGHVSYYMIWVFGFYVAPPWTVTDLATGVLQLRGCFNAHKTAGLAVSSSVTGIASLQFLRCEAL
jgi:hypothetical protein